MPSSNQIVAVAFPGAVAAARNIPPTASFTAQALSRPRQLWLHLHLPQLALEVLTRGVNEQGPCVLIAGEGKRQRIIMTNTRAAALGVRAGMPLSAAHVLGELTVLERDPRAEQRALEKLCLWAMQWTPMVSAVSEDGLLLEIKGSLKLFGGTDGLLRILRSGIKALGYRMHYAIAPTPLAATLLARANTRAVVLAKHELLQHLAPLSVDVMRLEAGQIEALESIGIRRLGECRRLPRNGLARRLSPSLVDTLDRLFGQAPDPRPSFPIPAYFESNLELPWEVSNALLLITACTRLLHELVAYLRANAASARRLRWRLTDNENRCQRLEIGLTQPGRSYEHLLMLTREKLMRTTLIAPIRAVELYVDDIVRGVSFQPRDLFSHRSEQDQEAYALFVDRLQSRYGEKALKSLGLNSDHRPENAWRWHPPVTNHVRKSTPQNGVLACGQRRPLWLIDEPLPLRVKRGKPEFKGPLRLARDRERIDAGWWDGHAVARDYFIATTTGGSQLWIYKELGGDNGWRLHGIFD